MRRPPIPIAGAEMVRGTFIAVFLCLCGLLA